MFGYLQDDVPAVLSGEVKGMGEGRTDGSSRAKMPQEYKRLQAAVLDNSLKDQRDQKARMVVVLAHTQEFPASFSLIRACPS